MNKKKIININEATEWLIFFPFFLRDEEINKLVSTINELTKIFKQMNQFVIDQGTVLDRIDFNIEDTLQKTRSANIELKKVLLK